jgi:hypothetical protein
MSTKTQHQTFSVFVVVVLLLKVYTKLRSKERPIFSIIYSQNPYLKVPPCVPQSSRFRTSKFPPPFFKVLPCVPQSSLSLSDMELINLASLGPE